MQEHLASSAHVSHFLARKHTTSSHVEYEPIIVKKGGDMYSPY